MNNKTAVLAFSILASLGVLASNEVNESKHSKKILEDKSVEAPTSYESTEIYTKELRANAGNW